MEPSAVIRELTIALEENPNWTLAEVFPYISERFPDVTKQQVKQKMKRCREKLKKGTQASDSLDESKHTPAHPHQKTHILGPFRIADIPGKGKGVVAARDIPAGEVILKEKPVLEYEAGLVGMAPIFQLASGSRKEAISPHEEVLRRKFVALSAEDQKQIMELHDAFSDHNSGEKTIAGIMCTNCVQRCGDTPGMLFLTVSRFNHSCAPNAYFIYRDHEQCENVVAVRAIRSGEEICVSYIDLQDPCLVRNRHLSQMYGFTCTCEVCAGSAEAMKKSDENRTLMKEIDNAIPELAASETCDNLLAKIEKRFTLAEEEGLTHLLGCSASDAFKLCIYARKPRLVCKKWCALTVKLWTLSYGENDPDVITYKGYLKKLPTPMVLRRSELENSPQPTGGRDPATNISACSGMDQCPERKN